VAPPWRRLLLSPGRPCRRSPGGVGCIIPTRAVPRRWNTTCQKPKPKPKIFRWSLTEINVSRLDRMYFLVTKEATMSLYIDIVDGWEIHSCPDGSYCVRDEHGCVSAAHGSRTESMRAALGLPRRMSVAAVLREKLSRVQGKRLALGARA